MFCIFLSGRRKRFSMLMHREQLKGNRRTWNFKKCLYTMYLGVHTYNRASHFHTDILIEFIYFLRDNQQPLYNRVCTLRNYTKKYSFYPSHALTLACVCVCLTAHSQNLKIPQNFQKKVCIIKKFSEGALLYLGLILRLPYFYCQFLSLRARCVE